MGGPPTDRVDSRRRSLHLKVSRNGDQFATDEFLRLFDFPIMRAGVAKRPTSIVPQQYLFAMNSPFMVERANGLVRRLEREASEDGRRIDLAYRLLYGRPPKSEETQMGLAFVTTDADQSSSPIWQRYAQVLISTNEFLFLQ